MFGLPPYPDALVSGFVLGALGVAWVIGLVRIIGLRSFSKMTAFDFVITLATGSLLASAATSSSWAGFLQCIVAIAGVMGVQVGLAVLRKRSAGADAAMQNEPRLLMRNGEFLDAAMSASRVSRADVYAKLRAANAVRLENVRAVVLETTGDISVLHGDEVDDVLLMGVRK